METKPTSQNEQQANRRYLTVWRWHFYAGLLVAPFLTLLAVTGLGMLLFANITGKEGERIHITPQAVVQPLSAQAEAARQFVNPETASVVQYIAPRADDMVAVFRVNNDDKATMVAVDPYTAKVVNTMPRGQGWYHTMDEIHGDMMFGPVGDYLLETTASLTILMIITGIYLWWAKQRSLKSMLVPKAGKGRTWWRSMHGAFGTWVSLILLLFCLSGIAWAGIWGGKVVQAWSQFPAGKWGVEPNPVSSVPTHGDVLNDGKSKEVPWILELTPMPVSGTTMGENGINPSEPMTLETVDRFAREIGFKGRYQLNLPKGETGVWTLSQDSMSYDMVSPTAIALHMGTLGWWSVLANVLFCLAVIFICVSGCVMWWKRRPSEARGLVPPAQKIKLPVWWAMAVPLLILAVIFPTAIAAIAVIWILDTLLLSRIPALARWFK